MASPVGKSQRKRRGHRYFSAGMRPLPNIFFCGDPHGSFDYINAAVREHHPDAVVILGDLQLPAPVEEVLAETLSLTQVWWIPGNHDTDTEEFYDRLWKGQLGKHNLHGRVVKIAGIRIAGLGGVFRGQIWMPDGKPNYNSPSEFVEQSTPANLWRQGLPRRHRSSIFPNAYETLWRQRADVLVTHEACGAHKKGFGAIDRLAKSLRVRWHLHGHQHEDCDYPSRNGIEMHAVGYRGIVDLQGNVIVPSELDPRDQICLQQAGEEPAPEVLDSVTFTSMQEFWHRPKRRHVPLRPHRPAKLEQDQ